MTFSSVSVIGNALGYGNWTCDPKPRGELVIPQALVDYTVALLSLVLAGVCALIVLVDIVAGTHQKDQERRRATGGSFTPVASTRSASNRAAHLHLMCPPARGNVQVADNAH